VRALYFILTMLARLPLSWLRAAGWLVGSVAYLINKKRRSITRINLGIAFPALSPIALETLVKLHMRTLGVALLDRVWLWFAPLPLVYSRLSLHGFEHLPSTVTVDAQPTLLYVPHFVGMEAAGPAWQAACHANQLPFPKLSIVFQKPRSQFEQAIYQAGRGRFASLKQFTRQQGIRPVLKSLNEGWTFHCSPDQDFGGKDAIFVDFFGLPAATLTVLPKLSLMLNAEVVPLVARMTHQGYRIEVLPAMPNIGHGSLASDCRQLNAELEAWIKTMPEQYLFSHRRYKTRPANESSVYD
jgi:Kdo2-lipid IVA lauroyltransferase/acyltransferase